MREEEDGCGWMKHEIREYPLPRMKSPSPPPPAVLDLDDICNTSLSLHFNEDRIASSIGDKNQIDGSVRGEKRPLDFKNGLRFPIL